jgi:hypothetical protein
METIIIIIIMMNVIVLFLYFKNFFQNALTSTINNGMTPLLLELQKMKIEKEFEKKLEDGHKIVLEKIDQITGKIKKEIEDETKDNLITEEKKTQIVGQIQENKPAQQSIQMSEENLKILQQLQGIQKKKVDERRKEFADKMKIIEKESEELEKGKRIVEERAKQMDWTGEFGGGWKPREVKRLSTNELLGRANGNI